MRRNLLSGLAGLALLGAGCVGGRSELDVDLDAGTDAPPPMMDAGGPPPIETSSKLDLLFVVDNSPNTDNFQTLLSQTTPYLLDRLAHPACVNGLGNVVAVTPNPTDPCPVGQRDFKPVQDLHLAVITTSLGGHGADLCSPAAASWKPEQNGAAHLSTEGPGNGMVPTYQDKGFLYWDPSQQQSPPGDSDLNALGQKLGDLVNGVTTNGCGFEAQLESIYRFLVDPAPYQSITVDDTGKAVPMGLDDVVIQQRADFVRPDSALMIVLITDENDCSTREGGQYFYSNQGGDPGNPGMLFHLPRARSECAKDPSDPCCASCGQSTPNGCPTDPACAGPPLDDMEDPINLRCFDQKRRFGIDFLYPVQRYVDGLSQAMITSRDGEIVQNPVFAGNRSPKLVMMTGIVGVPWQDIAKNPKALSDGYTPGAEVNWPMIVGDPTNGTAPADPLMVESVAPRTGTSPVTGAALAPPNSPPGANPVNGHERNIPRADDLQNACIYPRVMPKDCINGNFCFCAAPDIDTNPLCQAPDGTYSSTEHFSRALPGTRELRVLQGLGAQGTVASVCASNVTGSDQPTFAYRPAVDAMLHNLRSRLE